MLYINSSTQLTAPSLTEEQEIVKASCTEQQVQGTNG